MTLTQISPLDFGLIVACVIAAGLLAAVIVFQQVWR